VARKNKRGKEKKGTLPLQEVKLVSELEAGIPVDRLTNEEGNLMGILAGSRDTDSSGPVVIEMGQLVGEGLKMDGLEPRRVMDNMVVGGGGRSLAHALRTKEKVVGVHPCAHGVHQGAGGRVLELSPFYWVGGEEA